MGDSESLKTYSDVRDLVMKLRERSLVDGVVSSAQKAIISAAIFSSMRCEPCVKAYVTIGHMLGADTDYVLEVFSLVANAQGCAGDVWAARAVEFFRSLQSGATKPEEILKEMCDVINPQRMVDLIEGLKKQANQHNGSKPVGEAAVS